MEFIYDIFRYDFLGNAFLACVLSGITCGIIGTYIVARRMVFLCGGITHASFGGLGIAFYYGFDRLPEHCASPPYRPWVRSGLRAGAAYARILP